MERALSDDDIPTLPAFPVPGPPRAVLAPPPPSPPPTPFFPATLPRARKELVIDTGAEGFFAVGLAMNDIARAPTDEELAAWWGAQRRRSLARYVLAVVVVCLGIMAATAVQLG
ncbi:MAG: hypothetical protein QOI41_475 [Myxococcales bacterium]|nr:hypothetical protein [Myxococcales bacterium]